MSKILTKQMELEYINNEASQCPFCKSDDITGDGFDGAEGNITWQEVTCNKCETSWRETYYLKSIELLD